MSHWHLATLFFLKKTKQNKAIWCNDWACESWSFNPADFHLLVITPQAGNKMMSISQYLRIK
jgi:hypothetical protein